MFIEALDVDDVIAHLLVTEGFTSVEEVAFVPIDDLTAIEGFDENIAGRVAEPRPRRSSRNRIAATPSAASELGVGRRTGRGAGRDLGDAGDRSAKRASRRSTIWPIWPATN